MIPRPEESLDAVAVFPVSFTSMRGILRLGGWGVCYLAFFISVRAEVHLQADPLTLTLDRPEVAGVSMFRAFWDQPVVLSGDAPATIVDPVLKERGGTAVWTNGCGPIAFDALNRSILVRFPESAEKIADQLRKGFMIDKAELILPFRDEELWPMGNSDYIGPAGYDIRKNWGVDDLYRGFRPEWHAVASLLRRPWNANPEKGPTFNANVNGSSYWTCYGASDEKEDRFPGSFGPAEVSWRVPDGRLDVTASLKDPTYGASLAERLRTFAECGFLIRKWETYDHRYFTGCYEWATACGGRAILIHEPQLRITFRRGECGPLNLLPAPNPYDLTHGAPTAVMPSSEALREMTGRFSMKPSWMPDWQWKRVGELFTAQGVEKASQPFWYQFVPDWEKNRLAPMTRNASGASVRGEPDPVSVYGAWVDEVIGRQPRGWSGFESAREMTQWYLYGSALPGPARDAIRRYWSAWLMPDRETAPPDKIRDPNYLDGPLVHNMVQDDRVGKGPPPQPLRGIYDTYWQKTGDWRGNKSYFRSGFCWSQSTQNFNTTASAGALLGGGMIGSEYAMADGRHGVENFPLRMYCWSDGSGQEHLDHYYFALTMAGNKAIADFSPTPYDRLIGQSLLAKNIEELAGAYHPGLRSLIAGSSRTSLDFLLGSQDGLQHILHTLCPQGALRDYGSTILPGNIQTYGHDVLPDQVARQTLAGPWAPEWVIPMIEGKVLPFEAKFSGWGGAKRSCYLGKNYGIAVNALIPARVQIMAQWRRKDQAATSMRDLGTLDLRCGVNQTLWVNDGEGRISDFGSVSALQDRNAVIALTSPSPKVNPKATSLQSSIGLFNFQEPSPEWQIFVDGKRVEHLPFTCRQGQRITIQDGVTWLGIIPLAADDLGRDAEVILEKGHPQKAPYYKSEIAPALVINSYNYRGTNPIALLPSQSLAKTYGGFVFQIADKGDYPDFASFRRAFEKAPLEDSYDSQHNLQKVVFKTGHDTLQASTHPGIGHANLETALVNGKTPYLPPSIERDTPYCQQGLGHVEKNGAVLDADPGRRIFLQSEARSGVVCAWNPLPDLTSFRLALHNGPLISSDGKVGLTRVVVHEKQHSIDMDSRFKPGQEKEVGIANSFLITDDSGPPLVTVNGVRLSNLGLRKENGHTVYIVPMPQA